MNRNLNREEMLDLLTKEIVGKIAINNRALENPPEIPTITEDSCFEDLNLDSLDKVEFLMAIEDYFDIEISDEEASGKATVGEMLDLVESKL